MWVLGCWWLLRPGIGLGSDCFGHQTDLALESVGNDRLFVTWPPVPRCLGVRSDQLVLKSECLIGDKFSGDELDLAVGQGSRS